MTNSMEPLEAQRKAVPALRFAYGLIGIAGAAVTIGSYFKSPALAIAAILLTLVGMVLVWLFSGLTGRHANDPAARVLVWASVAAFVVGIFVLGTLAVSRQPSFLADLLMLPQLSQAPTEDEIVLIHAIFASGVVDSASVNPEIYHNRTLAHAIIDGSSAKFCKAVTSQDMRSKMGCVSVAEATVPVPRQALTPPAIAADGGTNACAIKALAKAGEPATIRGIDVSHHDSRLDWPRLAADGYYFAAIKASQGTTYVDRTFKFNWQAAGRAGFIRAAYHYLDPIDGKSQAEFFLDQLQNVGLGPCDLGAVLIVESVVRGNEPSPQARVSQADDWLQLVESAIGKRPLLYTSSAYLKHLGSPAELTNYPLWLMNEPSSPRIPPSGLRYLIWQTSGEGDLSASVFNGSAAELLRLAR